MKTKLGLLMVALLSIALLGACKKQQEAAEQTGQEVGATIKEPLDKAKEAAEKAEDAANAVRNAADEATQATSEAVGQAKEEAAAAK